MVVQLIFLFLSGIHYKHFINKSVLFCFFSSKPVITVTILFNLFWSFACVESQNIVQVLFYFLDLVNRYIDVTRLSADSAAWLVHHYPGMFKRCSFSMCTRCK